MKTKKDYPDLNANPHQIKVGDWVTFKGKLGKVMAPVKSHICEFWVLWSDNQIEENTVAYLLEPIDYDGEDYAGAKFEGGFCHRLLVQEGEIKAEVVLDDGGVQTWNLPSLVDSLLSATSRSQPKQRKNSQLTSSGMNHEANQLSVSSDQPENPGTEDCSLLSVHCSEELSQEEERDRLLLERKVERAFYEAGLALRQLRDRRLYRSTHQSFEEYCQDRFGFKRRHPYQLIDAANVVDNLIAGAPTEGSKMCAIGAQKEMLTNGEQILPTSERQVRPLTKLEPEQQREAWAQAVESAGGKVPSGRIVKDIVQRIKERTQPAVPNPYHVGEVCRIIAALDPELKGKGGLWCIVSEVHEFSCTVKTYQGEITIRLDNLCLIDYSSADYEAMAKLCDRLHQLYAQDLEETAVALVDLLGKLDRPYLTALEEKLLALLAA
jgi:hypothetical protein